MDAYSNIKAYRNVGLDIKGYKYTETSKGLAWSCKVYLHNKLLGLVSNNGDGGMTSVEIGASIQADLVAQLKLSGYKLCLTIQGLSIEEPTDAPNWFDLAITQMVDEVAQLRRLKRLGKTHLIVLQHSTSPEFSFYKAVPTDTSVNRIRRQLGADLAFIMNAEITAL
uniref:hypothetical protein n=1 Tax=Pseudomonas syringae TaxID=317 RepID=UPI001E313B3D|nr:hypothetical protein [Pseudomonas syringae]QOU99718.1 hypothetical protein [Pseudomonas syringae pv. actinidiae]